MIFTGVLASKRLNFGLAHDEDLSARRAIVGEYKLAKDGSVLPPKLKLQNTLYDYRKPTNHVLYSVLARSAWHTWGLFAHPEDWYIREWVIRLPAWLAGVFAVLALALLVARLAGGPAGVMAAWLLALHPWHLRYASEARGYSVLLLLVSVTLLVWLRATQENHWRWWLAFGLCQFLMLWVYPAAIYIPIVLNGLTALWLGREWIRRPDETRFRRWLAANFIAAIPATQVMLPLVPQLLSHLRTAPEARQPLTWSWLIDVSSNMFVGAGWNKSGSLNSPYVELAPRVHEHPVLFILLLVVLGVAAIAGTVRLTRLNVAPRRHRNGYLAHPGSDSSQRCKGLKPVALRVVLDLPASRFDRCRCSRSLRHTAGSLQAPLAHHRRNRTSPCLRGFFRASSRAHLSETAGSDQGSRDLHEGHLETYRRIGKPTTDSELSRPLVVLRPARPASQDGRGSSGSDAELR